MLLDEKNKNFITEAENIGRKLLIGIFLSYLGFPLPAFLFSTFIEYLSNFKERHVLLKVWLPWSREDLSRHILTNALTSVMSVSVIAVYVAIYFMEITFTLHITAYIKTLQNNLVNKGIRNEEIYEHHKVIIQLIKDYNEILAADLYLETVIQPLIPCGFGVSFLRVTNAKKSEVAKT
ncbi:hypothetical protein O3M35_002586 [Rhynocoris fuscipes]|uniref:Uncharacterized protein n=1 Tax=Rhynocoris fuscipes TaxID=488301 RepID=A0AAW1CNC7_9HEMI